MRIWILVVALVVVAVGVTVLTRTNDATAPPASKTQQQLTSGTKIIDVRTKEEYAVSHVKGAQLFPLQDMQNNQVPDIAKDTPIAIYCRSGNRSSQAYTILKNSGFTNVTDLGGLTMLARYGLKVE